MKELGLLSLKNLIAEAKELNATDIHFQPLKDQVKIYFRVQTKIYARTVIKVEEYQVYKRILKYWSKLELSRASEPLDSSFELNSNNQKINIRISIIPLYLDETIVLRLIYSSLILQSKIAPELLGIYDKLKTEKGMFIFTGSTGSGKTTTIYHLLENLALKEQKKVITIENPVEVEIDCLVQTEISNQLNLGYEDFLKATLRQDPDIIMIGEIRDVKTAKIAVQAALTGHTIITTMHTKDAQGVIERFLDFGFFLSEIKSILLGISHQKLSSRHRKMRVDYQLVYDAKLKELLGEFDEKTNKIK